MGVRDLEPSDEVAGALAVEGLGHRLADLLRDLVEVRPQLRLEVGPLVHLFHRDNQRVAVSDRLDGEEGNRGVVTVDKAARDFSIDDFGENRRHAPHGTRGGVRATCVEFAIGGSL